MDLQTFPFKPLAEEQSLGWELQDPCFSHSFIIYLLGELQLPSLEARGWSAVGRGYSLCSMQRARQKDAYQLWVQLHPSPLMFTSLS